MPTIDITNENLEKVITENSLVALDFWASWCGPCKTFAPVFDAASDSHKDVVFGKVNTEEQLEVAQAFNVSSIPTVALFRDQVLLYMEPGALPAESLNDLLTKIKALDMDEIRRKMAAQHQGCDCSSCDKDDCCSDGDGDGDGHGGHHHHH